MGKQLANGESEQLASHFDYFCETEFPSQKLAEHVSGKQNDLSKDERINRRNAVLATKHLVKELQILLVPDGNSDIPIAERKSGQPGLNRFNQLTHGFGGHAVNSSLSAFQTYLTEMMTCMDQSV